MNGLDDGVLLDRWRERRDGDAFAELARRHSAVVFDITCRVLGDRAGAEDVLQEALLSLALEPTRKPVDVGVVAWLARFAICRARNRRASERSRARRQIVVGKRRPEESMPDECLALSDELEHALAGCEPDDRALLAMRYLHGWDYDRIASALSIHEGAARVRVHRALQAVRAKVGEKATQGVAPALAALPLAGLSTSRIDEVIRSAVEIATVQLGAAPNGVEHATAATRSFRVAVSLTGAALLFVGAAGATVVPDFGSPDPASSASVAFADADPGVAPRFGVSVFRDERPASVDAAFRGTPRPASWDHGVLRRVAVGEGSDSDSPTTAASSSAAAPSVDPSAAPSTVQAPADPGRAQDPPSASRSISREACAAKGDPASSDGERAGAFGGASGPGSATRGAAIVTPSVGPADDAVRGAESADAVAEVPTSVPDAGGDRAVDAPRRRAERPTAKLDALPEDTRELVGAAEEAVRQLLAETSAAGDADDRSAVRQGIRDLRKHFAKMRRAAGTAGTAKAVRAKRGAIVREVLSLLAQTVLADGRVAGELRWPAGADLASALAEVIRVLGTRTDAAAQDVPAGADEPAAGGALPTGALPEGALR